MNPDTMLPIVLAVCGVLLQFVVRQFGSVKEVWYHGIAASLAFGAYVLMTPTWLTGDWRVVTLNLLMWMTTHLPSVWGGTFAMSGLSKAIVARMPGSSGSVFVPVTDSK